LFQEGPEKGNWNWNWNLLIFSLGLMGFEGLVLRFATNGTAKKLLLGMGNDGKIGIGKWALENNS